VGLEKANTENKKGVRCVNKKIVPWVAVILEAALELYRIIEQKKNRKGEKLYESKYGVQR
jgi:hypothetical protein